MTTEELKTRTENCETHGAYAAQVVCVLDKEIVMPCPICSEEQKADNERKERQRAEQQKRYFTERLIDGSQIPRRFAKSDFASYKPANDAAQKALATCKRYADVFEDRIAMGGGLVLCGTPGTGKTHLACAIANHVMKNNQRGALFTSATKMARAIKATYGKDSDKTESDVIRSFVLPDLLIIDEVGAQRGTETELLLTQEILDERYQAVRSTILISNLPEDELGKYIGERALDRMYEGGGAIVRFDWQSYRRNGDWKRFDAPKPVIDMSRVDIYG